MVVKRKNIFFEYHPFEKRGGVNLDGGDFEKKSGEKPFSLRPAPSSDTRPCPAEGGGASREQRCRNLCYYHQQPGAHSTA